jgi:signal transduction histidine kinase
MRNDEDVDALMQLAATMAHELNNIFTAVSGNLSLLEDSFDHQSPNAKVVGDVIQTARRGIELSQTLQAFAGRQRLNRRQFDLNQVVASTFTGLKQSMLQHIDVELGLTQSDCLVTADEEKFARVLEELARNAAAAMNNHGRLVVATTSTVLKERQASRLPSGNYVRLSVKDSGRGMMPDVAKRALDPLFSTKSGHPGWGLARCAGFIRQSGGDILLTSLPGKGTIVDVFLPSDVTVASSKPRRPAKAADHNAN